MAKFQVVIVGGGISGLSAFRVLNKNKINTIILEKSRGVGGRMSTRRGGENDESFLADIGAQFAAAGTAKDWIEKIQEEKDSVNEIYNETIFGKYPRYVHKSGMSSFVKMLITEEMKKNIFFSPKVTSFKSLNKIWEIVLENGDIITSDALIVTAPLPQALDLLKISNLPLMKYIDPLLEVNYSPCFALIVHPLQQQQQTNKNFPIWKKPSESIEGIYDQNGKGLQSRKPTWVVHTSAKWTELNWDKSDDAITESLLWEVKNVFLDEISFTVSGLHRWKYCEPKKVLEKPFWEIDFVNHDNSIHHPHLFLCGDSFNRSSVEGAYISGAAGKRE